MTFEQSKARRCSVERASNRSRIVVVTTVYKQRANACSRCRSFAEIPLRPLRHDASDIAVLPDYSLIMPRGASGRGSGGRGTVAVGGRSTRPAGMEKHR